MVMIHALLKIKNKYMINAKGNKNMSIHGYVETIFLQDEIEISIFKKRIETETLIKESEWSVEKDTSYMLTPTYKVCFIKPDKKKILVTLPLNFKGYL